MKTKNWYVEHAPFPREGVCHLVPDMDCPVNILLAGESSRLARINQLDPPADRASLKRFQKKLRAKLWEKFGTVYDHELPLELTEIGSIPCEGFTIHQVTYQSRPGIHVTALLYVPDGEGPFPAVVHMHGHNPEGKYGDRVQSLSLDLVKSGYVCLAVDAFGTYERAVKCYETEYHGGYLGSSILNVGETLMGCQVVDNMRAVDLLQSLPYVKANRIGATGASGGGNQTMWLAAMDERITAAMPVVSVGSFTSYVSGVNCICELLPDGLTLTEEAGVLALIAPRPLRIGNAYYDVNHTFAVGEMLKTYRQVQRVYWNLGYPDNIAYTVADRVHGMHDEQREAVLGWFACHLKNKGRGHALPEPNEGVMPVEEIRMFKNPADRPANVLTIDRHCLNIGKKLRTEYLARESYSVEKVQKDLFRLLRTRNLPATQNAHRYEDRDGWERWALEVGDHLIPILIRVGAVENRWKLLINPDGKLNITDEEVADAMADGSGVVAFDLFGTGETAIPNPVLGDLHQYFRQLLWVGRSLPGEWVFDILAVVRMLERRSTLPEISIRGWREAGVASVFAAALKPGKFSVEAVDSPASYLFCRDSIPSFKSNAFAHRMVGCPYTIALALPGFLKWGDVSLAAAVAGDVTFTSPRAYDGTPYTAEQEQAFKAEVAAVSAKLQ